MRAVRLTQFGAPLENQTFDDPSAAKGEVVVRVAASGICHSDVHYRSGRSGVALPLTLGHEIAGVVERVGEGVTTLAIGDRVAVHYLLSSGAMIGKDRDGGYAERIIVPERNVVVVPDSVPFAHAAVMMCSTATALHALRLASLRAGESVSIIGFGGLGISALQLARALGAGKIYAIDVVPHKLHVAERHGAIAIEASSDFPETDIALDFAGHPGTTSRALRALAPGGRLMIVAINLTQFEFDPYRDILARERRIIGCSDHTREELVDLMKIAARGDIDLASAITRTVPLDANPINAVLDELESGTSHLRTVIEAEP